MSTTLSPLYIQLCDLRDQVNRVASRKPDLTNTEEFAAISDLLCDFRDGHPVVSWNELQLRDATHRFMQMAALAEVQQVVDLFAGARLHDGIFTRSDHQQPPAIWRKGPLSIMVEVEHPKGVNDAQYAQLNFPPPAVDPTLIALYYTLTLRVGGTVEKIFYYSHLLTPQLCVQIPWSEGLLSVEYVPIPSY